jgi:ssDNA-binding Zn-finger/Zn-ribbon topoisomerase 1
MFHHPLFMPIAVGIVIAGVIYLVVSYQREAKAKSAEMPPEPQIPGWQVQCPKCRRWKKLEPVRREALEVQKISILPGTQNHFIHEYKCPFCGHTWHERYTG